MTNTEVAPIKGIHSITHDVHFGQVRIWVRLDGKGVNMRAASSLARGYIKRVWGTNADVLYVGRYGTVIGGAHGFRFTAIYVDTTIPPLNGVQVY